ncbi:AI-2E family transporter [Devosia nitrariae]|uniref:AI-2E family transporter n=1 Tax=Devosia nitrariae TaxID=2071872 RepID=A0ABQ5W5U4_9HYPH|nr:AI-2E family transporter [Devosia nitrariae]GLQ55332.1 AI-2E family transporter [Devosia nitrariae]
MGDRDQQRAKIGAIHVIVTAAAVIALGLLVWNLAQVLLLVFGSIVIATVLLTGADLLGFLPLPHRWRVALVAVLAVLILGGFGYLLGNQTREELGGLARELPGMVNEVGGYVGIDGLWQRIRDFAERLMLRSDVPGNIAGFTTNTVGVVGGLVLVLVGSVYFAVNPDLYKQGLLALCPRDMRARIGDALDRCGKALQLWMLGQLLTMIVVGVATTAGLLLIGVPSAIALGLLAGLFEFIPFLGPILAAVPAIVIAASQGGTMVFWVIGLYLLVQQIENNIIVPVVQHRTVDLPPALGLFSLLALGLLFGPLGVLLGTPLTVVLMVAVRELWIKANGD